LAHTQKKKGKKLTQKDGDTNHCPNKERLVNHHAGWQVSQKATWYCIELALGVKIWGVFLQRHSEGLF